MDQIVLLLTLISKKSHLFVNVVKKLKGYLFNNDIISRSVIPGLLIILFSLGFIVTPHVQAQSKYYQPATALVWFYHMLTLKVLENGMFPDSMYLYGD